MSTYLDRLIQEKKEIDDRLTKLNSFLPTDAFKGLSLVNQDLLSHQAKVMQQYSDILHTRIHVKA